MGFIYFIFLPILVVLISGFILYKAKIKESSIYYSIPIGLLTTNLMMIIFFDFSGSGEFALIGKTLWALSVNIINFSVSYVYSFELIKDKRSKYSENLNQDSKKRPIIFYLFVAIIIYFTLSLLWHAMLEL